MIKAEDLLIEIHELLNDKSRVASPTIAKHPFNFPVLKERDRKFLLEFENLIFSKISDFNLTIDDVASVLNISVRQLNRKIKTITNKGTKSYIQELRFWEARRLLEEKKVTSVKVLSYSVGFKDVKHFSRNFKQHFGKNPSEYL